jgi:hypothetical protein
MAKRTNNGIKTTSRQGFLANLLAQCERQGAIRVTLKAGGITATELHSWAVAHGMAYIGDILAIDNRKRRPLG